MRGFILSHYVALERLVSFLGMFGIGGIVLSSMRHGSLLGWSLVSLMSVAKIYLHTAIKPYSSQETSKTNIEERED
jgi:hypothetical protein